MALTIGTQFGSHEIISLLGKGGMGEVYRARDTKLKRDVAIKILPDEFSRDSARVSLFQREAEVLASLNHPNIAAIYDLQEVNDTRFLVLELVEGETLAERLQRGLIPIEDALQIAKQICEALEAAHEGGIIHRDLKPANVKITADGKVKVLDFGLAKAMSAANASAIARSHQGMETAPATAALSNSPTLISGTMGGAILGTAAYMSPEQARGRAADQRSDVFAFGCVLYEMLTGRQAFQGEDVSDVLASVIKAATDMSLLPDGLNPRLKELVRRCLAKDRKQRWHAIGDVRIELENITATSEEPRVIQPAPKPVANRRWIIAAATGFLATMAIAFVHFREAPQQTPALRYTIAFPEDTQNAAFAVSPDGRSVAMALLVNSRPQLWLRRLDEFQARAMPGTDGANQPFWSPDSRYIGFFAQGKLKKISATGGPPQTLCDSYGVGGGTWNREGIILFSPGVSQGALQRVPAGGGAPADIFKSSSESYESPVFLPDGRHFLYTRGRSDADKNGIYLASLDGKTNYRILTDHTFLVFAPPVSGTGLGHLLFGRDGSLMAQAFDTSRNQPVGEVFPVAEGVSSIQYNNNYLPASVSDNGVLVYWTGGLQGARNQLVWHERVSKLETPAGVTGNVIMPVISPDEKMIAYVRSPGTADIWLRDLARQTEIRFTSDLMQNFTPIWSPKGDRIAFRSNRGAHIGDLFWKPANGPREAELLLSTSNQKVANQWSRDGRFIVYYEVDPNTNRDIWVLPVDESSGAARKPIQLVHTRFEEMQGQLSPDSRWIAYTSDESGQREVYVRPFPNAERVWKVSTAGGEQPRWRGDGQELFYVAADNKMNVVPVKASAGTNTMFQPGAPVPLFDTHLVSLGTNYYFNYDVTADGKRFLIDSSVADAGAPAVPPLTVVINWNAGQTK
jgi:Tol biopolymer transport system component